MIKMKYTITPFELFETYNLQKWLNYKLVQGWNLKKLGSIMSSFVSNEMANFDNTNNITTIEECRYESSDIIKRIRNLLISIILITIFTDILNVIEYDKPFLSSSYEFFKIILSGEIIEGTIFIISMILILLFAALRILEIKKMCTPFSSEMDYDDDKFVRFCKLRVVLKLFRIMNLIMGLILLIVSLFMTLIN